MHCQADDSRLEDTRQPADPDPRIEQLWSEVLAGEHDEELGQYVLRLEGLSEMLAALHELWPHGVVFTTRLADGVLEVHGIAERGGNADVGFWRVTQPVTVSRLGEAFRDSTEARDFQQERLEADR